MPDMDPALLLAALQAQIAEDRRLCDGVREVTFSADRLRADADARERILDELEGAAADFAMGAEGSANCMTPSLGETLRSTLKGLKGQTKGD